MNLQVFVVASPTEVLRPLEQFDWDLGFRV